jgi:FkbM family methyltransferase
MTYYWDKRFLNKINDEIKIIFEAGARYGDESLKLSDIFPKSQIYSFECNPNTVDICKNKLENKENIKFMPYGLGNKNEQLPFYSYIDNNDGASSFFLRIDAETSQVSNENINIKKLSSFMKENNIDNIDLLCMDVQGFELNILKGAEEYLEKIKYVIMEEPKSIINTNYLPENVHSKYINSPTSQEIHTFMLEKNFIEIVRIEENMIEDNVMYKNLHYSNI